MHPLQYLFHIVFKKSFYIKCWFCDPCKAPIEFTLYSLIVTQASKLLSKLNFYSGVADIKYLSQRTDSVAQYIRRCNKFRCPTSNTSGDQASFRPSEEGLCHVSSERETWQSGTTQCGVSGSARHKSQLCMRVWPCNTAVISIRCRKRVTELSTTTGESNEHMSHSVRHWQ